MLLTILKVYHLTNYISTLFYQFISNSFESIYFFNKKISIIGLIIESSVLQIYINSKENLLLL